MILEIPAVDGTMTGIVGCTRVKTSLELIQSTFNSHTHVTEGANVPSAGLNIDADLSFQDNRLTTAQGVGFQNQPTIPLPPIGHMLYVLTNDLWYNDGTSDIQITDGAGVLVSENGFIDDYVNNVLDGGKAGFNSGANVYSFTKGNTLTTVGSTPSTVQCAHSLPMGNPSGSRLGNSAGAAWDMSFVGSMVTINDDTRPQNVDPDTEKPYARGTQNAIVARLTIDTDPAPPVDPLVLPNNYYNIEQVTRVGGATGEWEITFERAVAADSTIVASSHIPSAAGGTEMKVVMAEMTGTTTAVIRIIDDGAKAEGIINVIVVGMPA